MKTKALNENKENKVRNVIKMKLNKPKQTKSKTQTQTQIKASWASGEVLN